MNLSQTTYRATIDYDGKPAGIACTCSNCTWTGKASQLRAIEDCSLTPGDASPAGRCPKCDSLAYVKSDARELLQRAESFIAGFEDDDVQGPEGRELVNQLLRDLRAALGVNQWPEGEPFQPFTHAVQVRGT